MYTAARVEPVTLMYRGEEQTGWHVGVSVTNERVHGPVFGLCELRSPEYISHMCYGLEYFGPTEVMEAARGRGNGWFWFDAGTTSAEIKISADELERAFQALGLL